MIFNRIVKDYLSENKGIVTSYILVCSVDNIIRVLVTSKIYSSFLNKNADLVKSVKNVLYIWIVKFILSYSKSYLESLIIPNMTFYIRQRLLNDYIKTNELYFNDLDISTDVRQIIDVTKIIRDVFVWMVESVIPFFVLLIFINGYLLIKYPKVGAVNIVGNIVSLSVINNNYTNIVQISSEREEFFLQLVDNIDQKLNNMMNIFLNNKSDDTMKEIKELIEQDIKNFQNQYRDLENFSTIIKLTNYIFTGLSLYILYKTTDRENFINGLLIYTFFIQTQECIVEEMPKYMIMMSTLKNMDNYFQRKIYDRLNTLRLDSNYTNNLENFKGNIEFFNVFFKYEIIDIPYNTHKKEKKAELTNIINNLNLSIKSGERVVLSAKSGSGKTTLMKLLLGFYKPQSGNINLDHSNINTINPTVLRDKINYINQKTLLFQDTIINNMRYGNKKTEKEVIDFLRKYNLLNIFKDCDKSPDTCLNRVIQSSGLNMSLGMQKVIFLVRGILKSSDVYIFDEPLTSLDPKTRENIIKMIDVETKNKTVIIITHDSEINKIVDRELNLLDIQANTHPI